LCPLADAGLIAMVFERGYRVIEFNNLMVRPVGPADAAGLRDVVRAVTAEDYGLWCETVIRAFSAPAEPTPQMIAMADSMPFMGEAFFGDCEGRHAATAAMRLHDGVAALYGDATLEFARGRGLQQALILHRVALAAERGADWAMACVVPGTSSHRNYERCGFRLFYMRVNISRERS
jgi:GNAT superfamily N-acetyltransferase